MTRSRSMKVAQAGPQVSESFGRRRCLMPAWLFRRGYCFALVAAVGLLVCCPSSADPPQTDDLAGKKFSALKDKLPRILLKIFSELYWDAEVELARRTGPARAKIAIVFRTR